MSFLSIRSPGSAALAGALLLVSFHSAQADAPTTLPSPDEILERYVAAVGGRTAIEKLTTRRCTGREIDDRPYRGPEAITPFECVCAVPGRFKVRLRRPEGTWTEGFDGQIGWRLDVDGLERDDTIGRGKTAWFFDPQGALRIREYFRQLEVGGIGEVNGRSVYVVESDRPRAHYSLHFDVESGLLTRIGYYNELRDYREIDGVRIPMRLVRSRKGGTTTWELDRVEHDLPVSDDEFAAP